MKEFFKKHAILFMLLVAAIALFSNLMRGVLENVFGTSLMMSYVIDAVCGYIISILPLVLMVKWGYIKKSNKPRILLGFLMGTPYILFGIWNLLPLVLVNRILFQVQWGMMIIIVIDMFSIGLMEESIMRGVVLPLLCEKWQDRKHPYLKAAFVSSLLFGCVHLNWSVRYFLAYGTLSAEYLASNLYQVYYAFCVGMLAAGVTLYARSIVPMIIWHAFCDFTATIGAALLPSNTYENYCNNGLLSPQKVFDTYGILGGFKYGDVLVFGMINLLLLCVGVVLIRKVERDIYRKVLFIEY